MARKQLDAVKWLLKGAADKKDARRMVLTKIHPNQAGYAVAANGYVIHAVRGELDLPDSVTFKDDDGQYPHADEMLYQSDQYQLQVTVNPELLRNALEGFKELAGVEFYFKIEGGQVRGIKMTGAGKRGERIAIIMPMSPDRKMRGEKIASVAEHNDLMYGPIEAPRFLNGDSARKVGWSFSTQTVIARRENYRHNRAPFWEYCIEYENGEKEWTEVLRKVEDEIDA